MTRLSKSHIAIALFCFVTSGTAFAASMAVEARPVIGACVNVQTPANAVFGLGGRVGGGGIVLDAVTVASGAGKGSATATRLRLEPLSVTFNAVSEFRGLGTILTATYKSAITALNVVDVVSFTSHGTDWRGALRPAVAV